MDDRIMICSLPGEVKIAVLLHLDVESIAACKLACRCLCELIRNDLSIKYKIALGLSGLIDVGHDVNLSWSDRLTRLRAYQARLRTPQYAHRSLDDAVYPRGWRYLEHGDVYVLSNYSGSTSRSDTFSITCFRPSFMGVPELAFSSSIFIPSTARKIVEHMVNVPQDLLVVFTASRLPRGINDPVDANLEFKFFMLSTGHAHPLAAQPSLQAPQGYIAVKGHGAQVHGALFGAILFDHSMTVRRIHIWNWKTGALVWICNCAKYTDFYFIGTHHIFVLNRNANTSYVSALDPDAQPVIDTNACTHEEVFMCLLQLPPLSGPLLESRINCYFGSLPDEYPARERRTFVPDPSLSVIVLDYIGLPGDLAIEHMVLIIPIPSLLDAFARAQALGTRALTWVEWGPAGTVAVPIAVGRAYKVHVLGSRVALFFLNVRRGQRSGGEVVTLDVHRSARRAHGLPADMQALLALPPLSSARPVWLPGSTPSPVPDTRFPFRAAHTFVEERVLNGAELSELCLTPRGVEFMVKTLHTWTGHGFHNGMGLVHQSSSP